MENRIQDKEFTDDFHFLLKPEVKYNNLEAWGLVRNRIVEKF